MASGPVDLRDNGSCHVFLNHISSDPASSTNTHLTEPYESVITSRLKPPRPPPPFIFMTNSTEAIDRANGRPQGPIIVNNGFSTMHKPLVVPQLAVISSADRVGSASSEFMTSPGWPKTSGLVQSRLSDRHTLAFSDDKASSQYSIISPNRPLMPTFTSQSVRQLNRSSVPPPVPPRPLRRRVITELAEDFPSRFISVSLRSHSSCNEHQSAAPFAMNNVDNQLLLPDDRSTPLITPVGSTSRLGSNIAISPNHRKPPSYENLEQTVSKIQELDKPIYNPRADRPRSRTIPVAAAVSATFHHKLPHTFDPSQSGTRRHYLLDSLALDRRHTLSPTPTLTSTSTLRGSNALFPMPLWRRPWSISLRNLATGDESLHNLADSEESEKSSQKLEHNQQFGSKSATLTQPSLDLARSTHEINRARTADPEMMHKQPTAFSFPGEKSPSSQFAPYIPHTEVQSGCNLNQSEIDELF